MSKKKGKKQRNTGEGPSDKIQAVPDELAMRFIGLLERQMQAKDEQIRMLDARLQDAFDMQRALALIVRQYERRTGISSEVLWDQVPEEEISRDSSADEDPIGDLSVAEAEESSIEEQEDAEEDPELSIENEEQVHSPEREERPSQEPQGKEPRSFEDWLSSREF